MSENGERGEIRPQPTMGQEADAKDPSVRLVEIQNRWEKLKNNSTPKERKDIIAKLNELTASTKAPDHPGALHPALEPSSTKVD